MVKELRAATGAGVLDCRKALETASGDLNRATEILREKGLATAAKKASRQANEGLIGSHVEAGGKVAALVEVNCETDFVARTDEFQSLCQGLATLVAVEGAGWGAPDDLLAQAFPGEGGRTVKEVIQERVAKLGENIVIRRIARLGISSAGMIGSYVHTGSKVAALVEIECAAEAPAQRPEFQVLAKDLAMQVVAARPSWVRIEDVPAEVVAKEREGYLAEVSGTDQPAQGLDRILDGKLAKFYEESCLLEQPFIRNDSKRIKDVIGEAAARLGGTICVQHFERMEVGN